MTNLFPQLVKRIEDTTALDDVSRPLAGLAGRATRPDPVKSALSGTWVGHQLHPILTDLPIGAWVMASALDWTAGRTGASAARRLIGLGVVAALPAAATGASDWSETYAAEQRVGVVHAVSNLTGTALQACSWLARRRGRRLTGMALSTTGLGVTLGAAYLGGHLSFVRGVGVNHTAFEPTVTEWADVAALSELTADKPVRVSAGGVPVMLVLHDGAVRALSATCVHAGGPLDEGEILDGCVRCPWHSSRFALADGKVLRGPASTDEPAWDVRVDDGRVHVRSATPQSES
ncbi:MAG: Rieske 2Fe-2S domain-containing protein [Acidimicrobiaceae bacterium]|nr:Rieske 2Fe-2S domain-containing protein [Acidimicrobiaceae bacterium]